MILSEYITYAYISTFLWGLGSILLGILFLREVFAEKRSNVLGYLAQCLILAGLAAISIYIIQLWLELDRPPMRTKGETRLWYSFFMVLVSWVVYLRWKYKVLFSAGVLFGVLFLVINLANPEALNKTLPPSLQSSWFIPHVIVYMVSYAILGLSWLVALFGLLPYFRKQWKGREIEIADNLVIMGFGFLTLGLVFGALWAKEAWGHYWTWDPKETWAMITWLAYLIYIHYRFRHRKNSKQALWILFWAFLLLIICWLGISYLSVATDSVHTYSG